MPDDTGDRLARINAELSEVLEQRLGVLAEAVAASERVTRRIIAAEVEIERHNQHRTALEQEVTDLEGRVGEDRKRWEGAKGEMARLVAERDIMQETVAQLDRDLDATRSEVADLRTRSGGLEGEAEALRNENTALRTKHKTLEENLTRMRQLKDELMSSISGLTQQMSGLAGGRSE
jgi:chromosome segregation ATPase